MGKQPTEIAAKLAKLKEAYQALIPRRVKSLTDLWSTIQDEGWSSAHTNQLCCLAHNLAGSAGTFGAQRVGEIAREIEVTLTPHLKTEDTPDNEVIKQLRQLLDELRDCTSDTPRKAPSQETDDRRLRRNASLIYIVEDDTHLANLLATQLQDAGYSTQIYTNLNDFQNSYTDPVRPAAVIMDMVFPENCDGGADVIREMHDGSQINVPIIFTSVRDDIDARLAALRAGATRYITKPIDNAKLLRILDNLTLRIPEEPYRILLIDDDNMLLDYYSTLLRDAGLVVETISEPLKTFDIALSFKPDVIITDVYMPECTGLELAAILREEESFTETSILFLSTESNLERQLSALALGGDDFLTKPIEPPDLVNAATTRARRSRNLRRLNADLRKSVQEVRYQQYAIDQHACVCVTDPDGCITHINNRFCKASGYSRAKLIGQNISILKSGRHGPEFFEDMWNSISFGNTWRGQLYNARKDGSGFWMEYTIVPFLDVNNTPYQYVAVGTDITNLKQVQVDLQNSEERLRLSQEFASVGTWDWDIENDHIYWSETASVLFGLPKSARVSSYEEALGNAYPADLAHLKKAISHCLDSGQAFDIEYRVVWPDGSLHWLQASGDITPSDSDKPRHMLGILRDITKRKQAEEELRTAKETAEKASQAKTEFLSHMSHELRSPLNAILGFAQLMHADQTVMLKHQESVTEILQAGKQLLTMIDGILDLTKIESGHIELRLSPIPCHDVIHECLNMVTPLAATRKITLEFTDEDHEHSHVLADRIYLKQALLNLLFNAINSSSPGNEVSIQLQNQNNTQLRILVTDSGPAISEADRTRLFEPSGRTGSIYDGPEGAGIGLPISKKLATAMGGTFGYETKSGEGNIFWIQLPLAEND